MRQARHQPVINRIADAREYDRYRAGLPHQRDNSGSIAGKDRIRFQFNQLLGKFLGSLNYSVGKAIVESQIATAHPTVIVEAPLEPRDPRAPYRIRLCKT